jgi:hypothetical protein
MFNSKLLALSIIRSGLGLILIILSPILIGEAEPLIDFYKFVVIFSLISSVSILGLNNYIFVISSDFISYKNRRNFWISIGLFKIISILLVIIFLLITLFLGNVKYLDYALLFPFGYFILEQQVTLANKNYKKYLLNLVIPHFIFFCILIGIKVFGGDRFYYITACILFFSNLIFLKSYKLTQVYKILKNTHIRRYLMRHVSYLIPHIGNGLSLSIISPLLSLALIDAALRTSAPIFEVSSYFLYYRIFDGLVGFIVGYYIILNNHSSGFYPGSKYFLKYLVILFLVSITFLISNVIVYLSTGFYSIYISLMEIAISSLKLILALMAYKFIIKFPLLNSIREFFLYLFVLLLAFHMPKNIIDLQILVLVGYLGSFIGSIIFIKKSLKIGAFNWHM